jgi:hypothetical protein
MQRLKQVSVPVQNVILSSTHLDRDVRIDIYFPPVSSDNEPVSLLIINDGQDLPKFHFDQMLAGFTNKKLNRFYVLAFIAAQIGKWAVER